MGTGVSPKRIATRNIRYPVVSAQSDGDDRWKLASVKLYEIWQNHLRSKGYEENEVFRITAANRPFFTIL